MIKLLAEVTEVAIKGYALSVVIAGKLSQNLITYLRQNCSLKFYKKFIIFQKKNLTFYVLL